MHALRSAMAITFALCAFSCLDAAAAGAYAKVGPPPSSSTDSGLPDGRVYEQVSQPNKHGYQAGAEGRGNSPRYQVFLHLALAAPGGDAVAYGGVGPAAETNDSGLSRDFVAERTSRGWVTRSTTGRGLHQNEEFAVLSSTPALHDYSPDLKELVYVVKAAQVLDAPEKGYGNVYLLGSDPLQPPTWLLQAAQIGSIEDQEGGVELVGMTPDGSTVYLADRERLLPQDAARSGWGIYEYHRADGTLSEAGVLPDGSVPAAGAMPAATAIAEPPGRVGQNNPASLDNQLSEDGTRLFFVSAGQLYVHETEAGGSQRSVLASASHVAGHVGEAAPDGVLSFENPMRNAHTEGLVEGLPTYTRSAPTYAYASSDGSHVFFQSSDQLTTLAPGGSEPKVYSFDVDTEALEYLPDVTLGGIVAAAPDGSSFAFVNGSAPELDLWSAGPGGGSVSQIAQLPGGGSVGPARLVGGGSVLVFQALAPIPGFNDAGGEQIYRYDAGADELSCVSCPPDGVTPSGNSYLSAVDQFVSQFSIGDDATESVGDDRGVSSDGQRIFFSSPDPLVGRDINGDYDTYEWENGTVFLLSSGTSPQYSLFLDNSESGGDVFFATSDELVQGDNDSGFDVYDARIPRPGDNPPPSAVPCSGDVCQGPPSIAQLLGAPPSATFSGLENVVEAPSVAGATKSAPKRLTVAQKLASALRVCRQRRSKQKRASCQKQARKRYAVGHKSTKHDSRRGK